MWNLHITLWTSLCIVSIITPLKHISQNKSYVTIHNHFIRLPQKCHLTSEEVSTLILYERETNTCDSYFINIASCFPINVFIENLSLNIREENIPIRLWSLIRCWNNDCRKKNQKDIYIVPDCLLAEFAELDWDCNQNQLLRQEWG